MDEIQLKEILETDSDGENDKNFTPNPTVFVVCLQPRGVAMIFLPCQHCNTRQNCSDLLWQVDQRCFECRSPIDSRLTYQ